MEKRIELYEGLSLLEEGIQTVKCILDGRENNGRVTGEEYLHYHDCVYNMCNQRRPNYTEELFDRYKEAVEDSINVKILPCLAGKSEEDLMIEVISMWDKYKKFAKTLSSFFTPLNSICYPARNEPLYELAISRFSDLVRMLYVEEIMDAAIFLINRDRDGEAVDKELLKNISSFFMEFCLQDQFEKALLANAVTYYSQLSSELLLSKSSTEYLIKAKQCMLEEKERATQILDPCLSVEKILKEVHTELIIKPRKPLMKKRDVEKLDNTTYQDLIRKCDRLIS